jgi:hypothetical protein
MNRFFSRAEYAARLSFALTVGGLVTMLGCAADDEPADDTPSAAPAYVHQTSLTADGPLDAARPVPAEGSTVAEDDVEAFAANDDAPDGDEAEEGPETLETAEDTNEGSEASRTGEAVGALALHLPHDPSGPGAGSGRGRVKPYTSRCGCRHARRPR